MIGFFFPKLDFPQGNYLKRQKACKYRTLDGHSSIQKLFP